MAVKKGDICISGTQGGITCYFSRGRNIFRKASSLTGARVKVDLAFAGLRKSSNRLKEASPIAASLYSQVPKEKKEFSLYRLLTGETIKMIRDGIDKAIIRQKLYEIYIAPKLETQVMAKEFSDRSSGLKRHSSQAKIMTPAKLSILSKQSSKEKISASTSDLIYLGRVKGFHKLKIWLRPTG